jgi:uncharacterized membrane protein
VQKSRLEAFSDGVLAIILTIMVLDFKLPAGDRFKDLMALLPSFLSYVLSFIYVGIYWNNHHHLFQAAKQINGRIMWANLHVLFWISLTPFVTAWAANTNFSTLPVALYGLILMMAGFGYTILTRALVGFHGKDSLLAEAMGRDLKGRMSVLIYALAIFLAFYDSRISCALYIFVAAIWLAPDTRIERTLAKGR